MVLTHGIPPAFHDGYTVNRHRGSPEFIRSGKLRTHGTPYRESAAKGQLVVFKVVPVTGAAISGVIVDQFLCASLFPHPLSVSYGVDMLMLMCDTESIRGRKDQFSLNERKKSKIFHTFKRKGCGNTSKVR